MAHSSRGWVGHVSFMVRRVRTSPPPGSVFAISESIVYCYCKALEVTLSISFDILYHLCRALGLYHRL